MNQALTFISTKPRRVALLLAFAGGVAAMLVVLTPHSAAARLINLPAPGAPAGLFDQPASTHAPQDVDGALWSITTYPITGGKYCAGLRLPRGATYLQVTTCRPSDSMFTDAPVLAHFGARQAGDRSRWANMWVWGEAAPTVHGLELQMTNCKTIDVPLDADGVFLFVAPQAQIGQGVAPQELRALDASGTEIYSKNVVMAPPTEADGSARAGASAPSPSNCQ